MEMFWGSYIGVAKGDQRGHAPQFLGTYSHFVL